MAKPSVRKDHLVGLHRTRPGIGTGQMMNRGELHETLMDTGGRIIAKGLRHDIKYKHLGAGAYRVWVELPKEE